VHKAAPSLTVHALLWSTWERKRRAVAPAAWCHPCLSPCKHPPPRWLADIIVCIARVSSSSCIMQVWLQQNSSVFFAHTL